MFYNTGIIFFNRYKNRSLTDNILLIQIGAFFNQQYGGFGLAENSRHYQGGAPPGWLFGI